MDSSFLNSIQVILAKPKALSYGSSTTTTTSLALVKRKKNSILVCCQNNGNETSVTVNGYSSIFTERLKNQEEIGAMDFIPRKVDDFNDGKIGIVQFLQGKNLFITGATGFLAKVLIEKILRTTPDVGQIYLLIKAKNKEAAMSRLKSEIVNTELFSSLRKTHGENFQAFMLKKLIPVVGDVRATRLGIEAAMAEEISEEVDVIVNSAANTTFDERYDVALDINTIGPYRLMNFAKRFKRLGLFLQVSTAYVNGQRQGRVLEKPFCMGDTIAREMVPSSTLLDIEAEIKLAFASRNNSSDANLIQEMKDLGRQRAKMYGWQDTYVFTKAMGEMVINSMRGEIPVVTIRPSVIESTFKEPFPGWMEGNRMMDPIVIYYGKGQLAGFPVDPNGVLDVVPADMVVNAMLAAIAKHGWSMDSGMHIYHIASSLVNPLHFRDLTDYVYEHFNTNPMLNSKGNPIVVPPMRMFKDMDEFSSYVKSDAIRRGGSQEKLYRRLENMLMKSMDQVQYLASIYEPYTFYGGRFDIMNTRKLMEEMSEDERQSFGFDVRAINWDEYISRVHIPGLRRHVMKGRGVCKNVQLVTATM